MRFRCGKPCYIRQSCLFLHDIQNRLCKKLRIFVSKISIIRYPTNVSLNFLCPSETTRNCWFTEKEKSRNTDFTNYRRYCRRIVCWYSTIRDGCAHRGVLPRTTRTARIFPLVPIDRLVLVAVPRGKPEKMEKRRADPIGEHRW